MKLFFPEKGVSPLLVIVLLLSLQLPVTVSPFSPEPGPGKPGTHHRCGCAVAKAASGTCGCVLRGCGCSCCPEVRRKPVAPSHRRSPENSSLVHLRAFHCGGPEGVNINSPGIKFILPGFQASLVVDSALLPERTRQKPENLCRQPSVPPPEVTAPPLTLPA